MAVEKDVTRKCVVITWDTSVVLGDTCTIDTENTVTGGLGGAGTQRNDGEFALTYPLDFVGESAITVTGSDGGVEEGVIDIGNYVPVEPGEPGAPPVIDNTLPGVEGPVDPNYGIEEGGEGRPHPDQSLPGEQPEINPLDKKK